MELATFKYFEGGLRYLLVLSTIRRGLKERGEAACYSVLTTKNSHLVLQN